jgi:hypothetical protein
MIKQAWDTEDGASIVWGTHDPEEAYQIYLKQAKEWLGEGFEDGDIWPLESWRDAAKYWGHPSILRDTHVDEGAYWDEHTGKEHRRGYVPFLVVV